MKFSVLAIVLSAVLLVAPATLAEEAIKAQASESGSPSATLAVCASYYQLMAMGAHTGGSIEAAKQAEQYERLYNRVKQQAKQSQAPSEWLQKMYSAMDVLLAEMGNDVMRYEELYPRYRDICATLI